MPLHEREEGSHRPSAECLFPPQITEERRTRLVSRHLALTEGDALVAVLLAEGLTLKEMSVRIGKSTSTVKGRLERIAIRLRTRNSHEVSALAMSVLWWCACTGED